MSATPLSFPFGFFVADGSPLDGKYGIIENGLWRPFNNLTEANSTIISSARYEGLTVNINNEEYWWKDGTGDSDLVLKGSSPVNTHFLGKYTDFGALMDAYPTANDGDYAIIDAGAGEVAKQAIWDSTDGWQITGDIGYVPENAAYKATDFSFPDNVHYPTTEAVQNLFSQLSILPGNGLSSSSGYVHLGGPITQPTSLDGDFPVDVSALRVKLSENTSKAYLKVSSIGDLDESFNVGTGIPGSGGSANKFIIQPDGKVVMASTFTTYNGQTIQNIVRFNTNGSLDTSFTQGNVGGTPTDMVLLPNGKFIIAGSTIHNSVSIPRIARLNSDGTLDNTFNVGTGLNSFSFGRLVVQPDGKIIVVGTFTTYNGSTVNGIVRINTDGSIDSGYQTNTGTGFNTASSVRMSAGALQADGKLVCVGNSTQFNGVAIPKICRLNSDGTLDNTFAPGTGFTTNSNNHIVIQNDGKIIVVGAFTSYNGNSRGRLVRINTDGSIDSSYNTGTGFNTTPTTIALDADQRLLASSSSGIFFDGTQAIGGIARINTDGTLDSTFKTGFNVGSSGGQGVDRFAIHDNKLVGSGAFDHYNYYPSNRIAMVFTEPSICALSSRGIVMDSEYTVGPNSLITRKGSYTKDIVSVNSNTTLTNDNYSVMVDASLSNVTITLPDATLNKGRIYVLKKIDSSSNSVIVSAVNSQTIDGQPSFSIGVLYTVNTIQSDGQNWFIIS